MKDMYNTLSQQGYLSPPFTESLVERKYLHRVEIAPYEQHEFKIIICSKVVEQGIDLDARNVVSIPYEALDRFDGHPMYMARKVLADYINTQFPLHIKDFIKEQCVETI